MENFITTKSPGYELIDAGEGEKYERFGMVRIARPDKGALWKKNNAKWEDVSLVYEQKGQRGVWHKREDIPKEWTVIFDEITFALEIKQSKHLGVFPEQYTNWHFVHEETKKVVEKKKEAKILNLFGYTGGASLFAAKAGGTVSHVDASEYAISRARLNAKLSGLSGISYYLDDVKKFVEREIKRGKTYDGIILDPPVYGRGMGKGLSTTVWDIETDLAPLLERLPKLFSNNFSFLVISGYAFGYSHLSYRQLIENIVPKGKLVSGELLIQTDSGILLPAGITARWKK